MDLDALNLDIPDLPQALCRQVDQGELFFPEKGGTTAPAKQVCAMCPVRAECLQYALDRDERFGIWGGKSERERRALKRAAGEPRSVFDRSPLQETA